MKIIRLKWNNNGIITNTLCLVSEERGIVYDNFITNTIILKTSTSREFIPSTEQLDSENVTPRLKLYSIEENPGAFSGSAIWRSTGVASWLWGSERGSAVITHEGHYDKGKFTYHNFSATHYFILGNSDARASEATPNTIAYGYGFATPGITVQLSFTGSNYSLSFSSTLGSTSGTTGEHTHPINR